MWFRPAAALGALLVSLALPCPARGDAPPSPAPESTTVPAPKKFIRTIADYVVNGNTEGETKVIIDNGVLFVPVATVPDFGAASLPAGTTHVYLNQPYVSLDSLGPDLKYTWNEDEHKIVITIAASHFGAHVIDFHQARPKNLQYGRTTSGFVNYDLHEGYASGSSSASLALDGTLTAGPGDLSGNEYLTQGKAASFSSALYTVDVPNAMLRVVAGSLPQDPRTAVPGTLTGINVRRMFSIDPYFDTAPAPSLTTALTMPSVVQVIVNGRIVDTESLQPGILDLRDLPVNPAGAGKASIVVADANGKHTIAVPSYGDPNSLRASITDYSFSAATDAVTHDDVVAGYVRHGFTDGLTAGFTGLKMGPYERFATDEAVRTLEGTLDVALAQSTFGTLRGAQGTVQYGYTGTKFSTGVELSKSTTDWLNGPLAPVTGTPPVRTQTYGVSLYVGAPFVAGIAPYFRYSHDTTDAATLTTGFTLPSRIGPFIVSISRQGRGAPAINVQYSRSVRGVETSATYTSANETTEVESDLRRRDGKGSTDLTVDLPTLDRVDMTSTAEWATATYTADLSRQNGALSGSADYEGSLGFVATKPFVSAPIEDGFALVRVPGLPNVSVDLDGRPVGRTDAQGDLVIPQLVGGLANTIALHDDDLPISTRFDRTKAVVSPVGRAGLLVSFPYRQLHAWRGKIAFERAGKTEVPQDAQLTIGSGTSATEADLSPTGAFYIDDLAPGTYDAHVDADAGACDLKIVATPKPHASVTNLGTLTCAPH